MSADYSEPTPYRLCSTVLIPIPYITTGIMVKIEEIRESNLHYASKNESGLICVFAGSTSGIGLHTLLRISTMLSSPTFYIIGRSASLFAPHQAQLLSLNPSCKIIFLEADISLLSEVEKVSKKILSQEKRVDILYMSPGCVPLNGAQYTKENLDTCFTLSYYSRILLLGNLLPLLRTSPNPRILSVLNAGKETTLIEHDLGLVQNWSFSHAIGHTTTMMSLSFYFLSKQEGNQEITFIHAAPGLVKTGIFERLSAPEDTGILWRVGLWAIKFLAGWLYWVKGREGEESGERMAFLLMSERYGMGNWRVDEECEVLRKEGVVEELLQRGFGDKVWEFTGGVFQRVLGT